MGTSDKSKSINILLQDNTGRLDALVLEPSHTIANRFGDIPDNKIVEAKNDLEHE